MSNTLDDFLNELQNKINDDTIKDFGQKAFERWRNPSHMRPMERPDGYGRIAGTCGDTMEIFLRFKEGRVAEASFLTDGCGPSMICGSLAAELAHGKDPDELAEITEEAILEAIGGLPNDDRHCALLAANTLWEAIDYYMKRKI